MQAIDRRSDFLTSAAFAIIEDETNCLRDSAYFICLTMVLFPLSPPPGNISHKHISCSASFIHASLRSSLPLSSPILFSSGLLCSPPLYTLLSLSYLHLCIPLLLSALLCTALLSPPLFSSPLRSSILLSTALLS